MAVGYAMVVRWTTLLCSCVLSHITYTSSTELSMGKKRSMAISIKRKEGRRKERKKERKRKKEREMHSQNTYMHYKIYDNLKKTVLKYEELLYVMSQSCIGIIYVLTHLSQYSMHSFISLSFHPHMHPPIYLSSVSAFSLSPSEHGVWYVHISISIGLLYYCSYKSLKNKCGRIYFLLAGCVCPKLLIPTQNSNNHETMKRLKFKQSTVNFHSYFTNAPQSCTSEQMYCG